MQAWALVTDCLVDGKPIDGEFRILRTDGQMRTLHMMGEPVLDADGCTASMWAVLRDVSALDLGHFEGRAPVEVAARVEPEASARPRAACAARALDRRSAAHGARSERRHP